MSVTAHTILRDVFGYRSFRPGQEAIIETITGGEDVLAVMPTGAGKSLCFQIPAILDRRLTVVVSPLVALIDDQAAALRANGVSVAAIHSGHDREFNVAEWKRVRAGDVSLLYMSPERLMTPRMIAALQQIGAGLFVVDEAHCISKWGANFRPEYERLGELKSAFPEAGIAAFTATADRATQADIAEKLFSGRGRIVVQGFDRPNLYLAVEPKRDWKRQLITFLKDRRDESGVVYCLSRRATDETAELLAGEGFNAIAYHAGHAPEVRKANQARFMRENAIMVATVAFGMGIDKPDIRFVCHLNLPASMEAYYQEIGRAGRDGMPADTQLFFGLDDVRLRRQFIENDGEDREHILREHKRLDALLAYAEAPGCRRVSLLAYFDEEAGPCGHCDNCYAPPKVIDGTREAQALFGIIEGTGETFGGAHIVDVLRGLETEKIRSNGHERLKGYGAGGAKTKTYWQAFVRQAVAGRYLSINIQKFGALELTARGKSVLAGQSAFELREIVISTRDKPASRPKRSAPSLSARDETLLSALKSLRLEFARERSVPAYVIFSDATLMEMASARPGTLDELASVNGVGPKKLGEFGSAFLALTRG
ncbi:DNA helicase RecQ [Pararhizobium haloflavum]|uniref:DNA helicase RecQ n=1 Tax=Pararhizobium haloflavum TaxID=2037914 RepID=UPI001FE0B770|nr:DNA helicase RecQ [Pararhizobium haloflavum]